MSSRCAWFVSTQFWLVNSVKILLWQIENFAVHHWTYLQYSRMIKPFLDDHTNRLGFSILAVCFGSTEQRVNWQLLLQSHMVHCLRLSWLTKWSILIRLSLPRLWLVAQFLTPRKVRWKVDFGTRVQGTWRNDFPKYTLQKFWRYSKV